MDKENAFQGEYNSNRLYDIVRLSYKQITGNENKEIKSWSVLKSDLRQIHKRENKTDEEITLETVQKYDELFRG